jgi:hypothetical protein
MKIKACIPVIPSLDIEKSLRFWVDGLGLIADRQMRDGNKLIGCMVHNDNVYFWLNQSDGSPILPDRYEGIRLYWTPSDLHAIRERLIKYGFHASEIEKRDYGQTEFFVTDEDGYSHCFGVATESISRVNS